MTQFSVTMEGICLREDQSPTQILELLKSETSRLESFEISDAHSLTIICNELPPEGAMEYTDESEMTNTNSNTNAIRVEELKCTDSNSTLGEISSIDDSCTVRFDDSSGVIDLEKTKQALCEIEKEEELAIVLIPDHIVLTVDEKEKLFEEFETESNETVKTLDETSSPLVSQSADSDDSPIESSDSEDDVYEEKIVTVPKVNLEAKTTLQEFSIEDNNLRRSFSCEVPETYQVSEIHEISENVQPSENSQPSETNTVSEPIDRVVPETVEIQDGAREFEMELSSGDVAFQSTDSNDSSRRASFEEDADDRLDTRTLDVALELETKVEKEAPKKEEAGWSGSEDEKEIIAKVKSADNEGWSQSEDEERDRPIKNERSSYDDKLKVTSDGSHCGDIRERGNVIDESKCSGSWNRNRSQHDGQNRNNQFQKNRNRDFGDDQNRRSHNYENRQFQQNRHFDKAPGGSNRPRDQNRQGQFERYSQNDSRRRSFNSGHSDRSFNSWSGSDRNDERNSDRNNFHRDGNRNRTNNDYNRTPYNNDNNNYGQRSFDPNRKNYFDQKENRNSGGEYKDYKQGGYNNKRRDFDRREQDRDLFEPSSQHHDRRGGNNFERNNRRQVRLNQNPNAKITFVNDHCTRGEVDPSDKVKMRQDLNFERQNHNGRKSDVEAVEW